MSTRCWSEIDARIGNYLEAGGLFNPEMMEHMKVRDLLMDIRKQIGNLSMNTKPAVITWDYKEQPDWDEINFALIEQWSAFVHPVDTGTDQFGIVIGPKEMTPEQAQARYEEWYATGGVGAEQAETRAATEPKGHNMRSERPEQPKEKL